MIQLQLDGGGGLPADSFHEKPVGLGHSVADPSLYRVGGKNTNLLPICMISILSARFSQLGGAFSRRVPRVYVCVTMCV